MEVAPMEEPRSEGVPTEVLVGRETPTIIEVEPSSERESQLDTAEPLGDDAPFVTEPAMEEVIQETGIGPVGVEEAAPEAAPETPLETTPVARIRPVETKENSLEATPEAEPIAGIGPVPVAWTESKEAPTVPALSDQEAILEASMGSHAEMNPVPLRIHALQNGRLAERL